MTQPSAMLDFARQEASIGDAITMAFANARLVPQGGVAVPVIFDRSSTDATMGQAGMASRTILASGVAEQLGADVQPGTRCVVYYDEHLVHAAGDFEIFDRDDDIETGMARLVLQLASA